jgi:hypothetical protein
VRPLSKIKLVTEQATNVTQPPVLLVLLENELVEILLDVGDVRRERMEPFWEAVRIVWVVLACKNGAQNLKDHAAE